MATKYTNVRIEVDAWRKFSLVAWRRHLSRTALLNLLVSSAVKNSEPPSPEELKYGAPNPNEMIDTPPVADSMHEPGWPDA